MLVDSGASHNFAPARLVQALQLPVVAAASEEVRLPNGAILQSKTRCKVQARIADAVTRKISFVVVDMQLPFVLGMSFLSAAGATVDFGTRTMQIGQTTLHGSPTEPTCELNAITMQTARAYDKLGRADVFFCSAK